ncbi:MAG: hypothetical protein EZS28_011615 [Streblomastix strix]|uniref:Uncharacterized protein n=1 Tax=Streblomastix strix TaxID=222440 RepID=A0A5J4WD55_9EUKA|nr:MAG: hypothetical protein EZS28_011615 [Streblomastix strix]
MLRGEEFQLIGDYPTLALRLEPPNIQKNQLYSGRTQSTSIVDQLTIEISFLSRMKFLCKPYLGAQYHQTFLKFNGKIQSKDNCRIILQLKYWKHCLKRLGRKSENTMKVQTAIHRANQENSNFINEVRTRNIKTVGVGQLHQTKIPILHKVAEVILETCAEGVADLPNQKLSRETQLVLLEFQVL